MEIVGQILTSGYPLGRFSLDVSVKINFQHTEYQLIENLIRIRIFRLKYYEYFL